MNTKTVQIIDVEGIVASIINAINKMRPITLVDLIAYISSRPFNMKGQEFEEIVSYMLNKKFQNMSIGASVERQSNKKSSDLILKFNDGRELPFSIKNYKLSRVQISTFAKDLEYFRNTYITSETKPCKELDSATAKKLINDIKEKLEEGITLFALTQPSNSSEFSEGLFPQVKMKAKNLRKLLENDFFNDEIPSPSTTDDILWLNQGISDSALVDMIFNTPELYYGFDSKMKTKIRNSKAKPQTLKSLKKLNRKILCDLYPQNAPSVLKTKEVDVYIRTLNKNHFLDGIDKIVRDKTDGETSHEKFWFYLKGVSDPVFSLDLGKNALNRGLWFTDGDELFNDLKRVDLLKMIFNEVLTEKHVDMSIWNNLDADERTNHFLEFLKLHKKKQP